MPKLRSQPNRQWSADKKLEIIKKVIDDHENSQVVSKEYNISNGMLWNWIKKYKAEGYEGLKNRKKTGNPLSKYQARKSLSELEKLQYENLKLKIENERLKKGYIVKGDGQTKQFISTNKKSLR